MWLGRGVICGAGGGILTGYGCVALISFAHLHLNASSPALPAALPSAFCWLTSFGHFLANSLWLCPGDKVSTLALTRSQESECWLCSHCVRLLLLFNMRTWCQVLTVTCPLGVSGGSQVITIVDELNGRTCTFRGALSISETQERKRWRVCEWEGMHIRLVNTSKGCKSIYFLTANRRKNLQTIRLFLWELWENNIENEMNEKFAWMEDLFGSIRWLEIMAIKCDECLQSYKLLRILSMLFVTIVMKFGHYWEGNIRVNKKEGKLIDNYTDLSPYMYRKEMTTN